MTSWRYKARLLLVRAWTESLASLRAVLREAQILTTITRVDTEPALNAALTRSTFDAVVFDPTTPGVTHGLVARRLREHGIATPIIVLHDVASLPAALLIVLQGLPN